MMLMELVAPNWTIYGCGKFDHEATSALVFEGEGGNTTSPGNLISYGETTSAYGPQRVGVVYTFPPGSDVTSRVGISYISSSKACDNLHREISDISFDDLVTQTRDVWKKEVLSKITLPNGTEEDKRLLYSMMYGSFLMPTNKTDENPGWESSEPYYEDTFTFWDTHRCATAMWQVLVPRIYEEYLRAIIDTFRFEGWISDARSSFWNGKVQGGSNSDNVLADAYVKGVRGKINWEDAYASMIKNAEVVPENNFDPMANDSSTAEGRGALPDYLEYGYITPNYSRSVSRAIEYSVNDFCVSQVAYGLGKQDDGDKYLARSRNWRNHWNPEAESLGYKGFVVPRYANGSFAKQDPLTCDGCYWMDEYYQAPPWEYSWAATHDTAKVVEWTGSPEEFVNRLDVMFEPGINPDGSEQFNYTLHNPGNQPGYIVPYLYNYAGRQDLSTARARRVAKKYYGTGLEGIPGTLSHPLLLPPA
jgi:predicted alpha-1,2-mannosidase